jgi:hypothetical protein
MSAECQLCDLAIRTTVHDAGDSQYVIVDCVLCRVPMIVWREHTMTIGPAEERKMERALRRVGDALFGPGRYYIDRRQRKIPHHLHWHCRRKLETEVEPAAGTRGWLRCVHKVARGVREVERVRDLLDDIRTNARLLAKKERAVFAYRIDLVPEPCRDWVLVVFEVEERLVERRRYPIDDTGRIFEYYEIPRARGEYLAIRPLGFLNAPGYPVYAGPIRFVDTEPAG